MLTRFCQVYLAVLSTYHVISGILSYFFGPFAMRFYKAFYGTDPVEQRHLLLILKPWGALSICVGLMGWTAVPDPSGHRGLVAATLLLLLLRITYRVTQRHELRTISRVSGRHNAQNVGLLVLGVLVLTAWLGWGP